MDSYIKIKQYIYIIIIAVVSLIATIFFPMISAGADASIATQFPKTDLGWAIYITGRVSIAFLNVIIFHSCVQQSKINVSKNEKYIAALEILGKCKSKKYIPRSPAKFNAKEYGSKGISILFSSLLSVFVLSEMILKYDTAVLLTYIVTIVLGIIFGIMEMLKYETYWTTEFYDYAVRMQAEKEEEEKNNVEEIKQNVERTEILQSNIGTTGAEEQGSNSVSGDLQCGAERIRTESDPAV